MPLATNPKIQISLWAQTSTFLLRQAGSQSCRPSPQGRAPCTALASLHGSEHRAGAGGTVPTVLLCLGPFYPFL